ncbi:MAG: hypothetical protein WAV32_08595, partial [Halobacteriota archaeon]
EGSKQHPLTRIDLDNALGKLCFVKIGIKSDVGLAIQRTMEDLLVALEAWGYRGIPMIVDRGMLSTQNIKIAREKGFHIIGCCPETSNEVASALSYWNDEDISKWENAVKRYSEGMVYVKGWTGALYSLSGSIVLVLDPARKAM